MKTPKAHQVSSGRTSFRSGGWACGVHLAGAGLSREILTLEFQRAGSFLGDNIPWANHLLRIVCGSCGAASQVRRTDAQSQGDDGHCEEDAAFAGRWRRAACGSFRLYSPKKTR